MPSMYHPFIQVQGLTIPMMADPAQGTALFKARNLACQDTANTRDQGAIEAAIERLNLTEANVKALCGNGTCGQGFGQVALLRKAYSMGIGFRQERVK